MSEVEKKTGYCVRWDVEKGCVSPSKIIHLCSGYNGPGRCKFDGNLKVEFKQRLPFPLIMRKRGV